MIAVLSAACSTANAGTVQPQAQTAPAAAQAASGQAANQQGAAGGRRGAFGTGNFAAGQVQAVNGDTIQVNTGNEVLDLKLSNQTQIQKTGTGTLADLQPGTQISVRGTSGSDGTLTAATIQIGDGMGMGGPRGGMGATRGGPNGQGGQTGQNGQVAPNNQGSQNGQGSRNNQGMPGRSAGGQGAGGANAPVPPSGTPAPGGAPNGRGQLNSRNAAFGQVKQVSGDTVELTAADGTVVTVKTTDQTQIEKTVQGSPSDITVGENLFAQGTRAADGSFAADTIRLGGGMPGFRPQDGPVPAPTN